VRLDDLELPASQLDRALPVDPGSHVLIVSAEGCADSRSLVTLQEGEQRTVTVAPGLARAEAPLRDRAPVRSRERERRSRWPLLVGVSGVALGITGGILVALAHSDFDDLSKTCMPICAHSVVDGVKAKETAGYVFVGGGAAAVATSLIWWLSSTVAPEAMGHLQIRPTVGGLMVSRAF
jgi:hypothetical protein